MEGWENGEHGEFDLSSRLFNTRASERGDGSVIQERTRSCVSREKVEHGVISL